MSDSDISDISSLSSAPTLSTTSSASSLGEDNSSCGWFMPLLVILGLIAVGFLLYNYWCEENYQNDSGTITVKPYVVQPSHESFGAMQRSNGSAQWNGETVPSRVEHGQVKDLDAKSFLRALKTYPVLVVAFVANGCGHCTTMKPNLHAAAKKSKIPVFTAHAHREGVMDLLKAYGIMGFPTVLKFVNGQKQEEYMGNRQPDDIAAYCNGN